MITVKRATGGTPVWRRILYGAAALTVALAVCAGDLQAAPKSIPIHTDGPRAGMPLAKQITGIVNPLSRPSAEPRNATPGENVGIGTVTDYAWDPVVGTDVFWSNIEDGWLQPGNVTQTNGDGVFVFPDLPTTTQGEILAILNPGEGAYIALFPVAFVDDDVNVFSLTPGETLVSSTRAKGADWTTARFILRGSGGSAQSQLSTAGGGARGRVFVGDAYAVAPDVSYGCAFYGMNQAAETTLDEPRPVEEGAFSPGDPIAVRQQDAAKFWIEKPYWASGAPGTTVTLKWRKWPVRTDISFMGYSEWPLKYTPTTWRDKWITSRDLGVHATTVRIPGNATPGYNFDVELYRSSFDSSLNLVYPFQVCTLEPSQSRVSRCGSVQFTGVVPVAGHWDGTMGTPKNVTVYRRTTKPAGQPTRWQPRSWTKVGTYRTNRAGRFSTGKVRVCRDTWFIAHYPGDRYYYRAYTSVAKVRAL